MLGSLDFIGIAIFFSATPGVFEVLKYCFSAGLWYTGSTIQPSRQKIKGVPAIIYEKNNI